MCKCVMLRAYFSCYMQIYWFQLPYAREIIILLQRKDTKIFCIYQILACDKERFSAKHLRFETSLKNGLCFLWGASLCFCGIENYILRYKSAYYEVIPDYRGTYSVFSIQFFSGQLPFLWLQIISNYFILYIYILIYIYNILSIQRVVTRAKKTEY